MAKRHLFSSEKLDDFVKNCLTIKDAKLMTLILDSKDKDAIRQFGEEIMLNRAILGDEETSDWLETTIRLNKMMYDTYGKGNSGSI